MAMSKKNWQRSHNSKLWFHIDFSFFLLDLQLRVGLGLKQFNSLDHIHKSFILLKLKQLKNLSVSQSTCQFTGIYLIRAFIFFPSIGGNVFSLPPYLHHCSSGIKYSCFHSNEANIIFRPSAGSVYYIPQNSYRNNRSSVMVTALQLQIYRGSICLFLFC